MKTEMGMVMTIITEALKAGPKTVDQLDGEFHCRTGIKLPIQVLQATVMKMVADRVIGYRDGRFYGTDKV